MVGPAGGGVLSGAAAAVAIADTPFPGPGSPVLLLGGPVAATAAAMVPFPRSARAAAPWPVYRRHASHSLSTLFTRNRKQFLRKPKDVQDGNALPPSVT